MIEKSRAFDIKTRLAVNSTPATKAALPSFIICAKTTTYSKKSEQTRESYFK